jgi:hypothetical protein
MRAVAVGASVSVNPIVVDVDVMYPEVPRFISKYDKPVEVGQPICISSTLYLRVTVTVIGNALATRH